MKEKSTEGREEAAMRPREQQKRATRASNTREQYARAIRAPKHRAVFDKDRSVLTKRGPVATAVTVAAGYQGYPPSPTISSTKLNHRHKPLHYRQEAARLNRSRHTQKGLEQLGIPHKARFAITVVYLYQPPSSCSTPTTVHALHIILC